MKTCITYVSDMFRVFRQDAPMSEPRDHDEECGCMVCAQHFDERLAEQRAAAELSQLRTALRSLAETWRGDAELAILTARSIHATEPHVRADENPSIVALAARETTARRCVSDLLALLGED